MVSDPPPLTSVQVPAASLHQPRPSWPLLETGDIYPVVPRRPQPLSLNADLQPLEILECLPIPSPFPDPCYFRFIKSFTHPFDHWSVLWSISSSVHLAIPPSTHPSVHLPTHFTDSSSTCLTYPSVHHPSIHPFAHPPTIHLCIPTSIHPSDKFLLSVYCGVAFFHTSKMSWRENKSACTCLRGVYNLVKFLECVGVSLRDRSQVIT